MGHSLRIDDPVGALRAGGRVLTVENLTVDETIEVALELTDRQREIILEGGLLPYVAQGAGR